MLLIETADFQKKILEYMYSPEFDTMFNSTIFANREQEVDGYKQAVRHGMAFAATLASTCLPYEVRQMPTPMPTEDNAMEPPKEEPIEGEVINE